MRKTTDYMLEQQIFLGGQVSHKHKEFMDIALMSPDYADLYMLIKMMPEWEKEADEDKILLEILKLFGEIDLVRNSSELTRLSMIMGDTRARYKARGVIDELRKARSNTTT
jgi:hypothetical protein